MKSAVRLCQLDCREGWAYKNSRDVCREYVPVNEETGKIWNVHKDIKPYSSMIYRLDK